MAGPFNKEKIFDEDNDLIVRFKTGEPEAFDKLLKKYQKPIAGFIRRFLGTHNQSEVEDLAQEVFLKVYKGLAWYQPEGKFTAYLYKAAANCCISYLRKNKKITFVSIQASQEEDSPAVQIKDTSADLPGESMLKEELSCMIDKALQSLPEEQRIPVILSQYHGFTYREIASVLGCSGKAIERRLYRARMKLKEKLLPYLQKGLPVS